MNAREAVLKNNADAGCSHLEVRERDCNGDTSLLYFGRLAAPSTRRCLRTAWWSGMEVDDVRDYVNVLGLKVLCVTVTDPILDCTYSILNDEDYEYRKREY